MVAHGIPDIGDVAAGRWGDATAIGRVVSKNGGTQIALFSDQPGPAQVITITDAQTVSKAAPQWSKDLGRAEQIESAKFEQWREGIEARRIDALERATYATAADAEAARLATIRAARAARGRSRGIDREIGE